MRLVTYAYYRTDNFAGAQPEYNAVKFIQAIKGDSVSGYADIPLGGRRWERLKHDNRHLAAQWFADVASVRLGTIEGEKILVPIPHHDRTSTAHASKTAAIATAMLSEGAGQVWDGLVWRSPQPSSRSGGPRDPQTLYRALRLEGSPPLGRRYVLIDDVVTSGGHIRAAAARLVDVGCDPEFAIVAGQTTTGVVRAYFGWVESEVERYDPRG